MASQKAWTTSPRRLRGSPSGTVIECFEVGRGSSFKTEAPSTTPSRPCHQEKKLQPKIVHRTIYVLHPLPPERMLRSRRSLLTLFSLATKYDEVSLAERSLLHARALFYVGSLAFDRNITLAKRFACQEILRHWQK